MVEANQIRQGDWIKLDFARWIVTDIFKSKSGKTLTFIIGNYGLQNAGLWPIRRLVVRKNALLEII